MQTVESLSRKLRRCRGDLKRSRQRFREQLKAYKHVCMAAVSVVGVLALIVGWLLLSGGGAEQMITARMTGGVQQVAVSAAKPNQEESLQQFELEFLLTDILDTSSFAGDGLLIEFSKPLYVSNLEIKYFEDFPGTQDFTIFGFGEHGAKPCVLFLKIDEFEHTLHFGQDRQHDERPVRFLKLKMLSHWGESTGPVKSITVSGSA